MKSCVWQKVLTGAIERARNQYTISVRHLFNTHGCEVTDLSLIRDDDVLIAAAHREKFKKPSNKVNFRHENVFHGIFRKYPLQPAQKMRFLPCSSRFSKSWWRVSSKLSKKVWLHRPLLVPENKRVFWIFGVFYWTSLEAAKRIEKYLAEPIGRVNYMMNMKRFYVQCFFEVFKALLSRSIFLYQATFDWKYRLVPCSQHSGLVFVQSLSRSLREHWQNFYTLDFLSFEKVINRTGL